MNGKFSVPALQTLANNREIVIIYCRVYGCTVRGCAVECTVVW